MSPGMCHSLFYEYLHFYGFLEYVHFRIQYICMKCNEVPCYAKLADGTNPNPECSKNESFIFNELFKAKFHLHFNIFHIIHFNA